ncbi:MAG: sigma-70 family RNA polymerase sigma factor [Acidimicrobiales bacterium]|nr:sigma-70 family RNA polymerase sigma factor [Acidimicrobiales bacterium]
MTTTNRLTRPLRVEERLIREHMYLVGYAVSQLATRIPRHVNRDDLESAGMAALAGAARGFDPERGVRFDRYANTRIKGALLDELRRADWATRSVRSRARQVAAVSEKLTPVLGRTPMPVEIAGALGWDPREVIEVADNVNRAVVLTFDGMTAEGISIGESVADDGLTPDLEIEENEKRGYLVDAVATLPDRLRQVIIGSFLEDKTMAVLAEEIGVTESRISQMRTEALALLKVGLEDVLSPKGEEVAEDAPKGRRPHPNAVRAEARRDAYRKAVAKRSSSNERVTTKSLASLLA